ncbi:ATP-binding protein [Acutalibacter muris]|jgi:hypothetical protein|uniref:ATP-binding protein n=1 Tax=Acutalibacter muris TaxID=1796620 RepID=UPI0026F3AF1D|nr:ATP-binding protein [Acutalibacter muris]
MSKYPTSQRVAAVYDPAQEGNPFLAAMPKMLAHSAFMAAVRSLPPLPAGLGAMMPEERRQHLPMLSSLFIPMDYTYVLYDQLFRALSSTYSTRTMLEEIQRTNALFRGSPIYATQPATGSILGVPGVGKSSTIRRSLSLLPQVIEHEKYQGKPFFCKQILYLIVECPSDCSVKTLGLNIAVAIDKAIGSSYAKQLTTLRSATASAIATQVKVLCLTHHVGLILIDEIQNAVTTAQKNKQIKPLIKFLVELTNDTCTSAFFVGTPIAEELFSSQEHLKRRTRGMRLLPFKPDGAYRAFLQAIWPYQLTPTTAPLSEQLANKLYDHSGGIPAYIIKIFQESQAQALLQGESCISAKTMQRAIERLAIKVPRTFSGGTHISDFEGCPDAEQPTSLDIEDTPAPVSRLYAKPRGRKAAPREETDLLLAYQGDNLENYLRTHGLLEEWPC